MVIIEAYLAPGYESSEEEELAIFNAAVRIETRKRSEARRSSIGLKLRWDFFQCLGNCFVGWTVTRIDRDYKIRTSLNDFPGFGTPNFSLRLDCDAPPFAESCACQIAGFESESFGSRQSARRWIQNRYSRWLAGLRGNKKVKGPLLDGPINLHFLSYLGPILTPSSKECNDLGFQRFFLDHWNVFQ